MKCGICGHSFIDETLGGLLVCKRYPPQPTAFKIIYPQTVGGAETPEDQIRTFFGQPAVHPEGYCAEFKARG